MEKLKCLLSCFGRVTNTAPTGLLTFSLLTICILFFQKNLIMSSHETSEEKKEAKEEEVRGEVNLSEDNESKVNENEVNEVNEDREGDESEVKEEKKTFCTKKHENAVYRMPCI